MSLKSLLILGLFVATTQAGVIDEEFAKSFSTEGDQKDAIVEFSPVVQAVLQHSSLQGVSGNERHTKIVSLLQSHTKAMQLPILNSLKAMGVPDEKVQPYWIANKIAVKGVNKNALQALSAIPGPFTVREARTASIFPVQPSDSSSHLAKRQTDEYQYNVRKINAPDAWSTSRGAGIVIGVIDTGARVTHEALRDNYRGGPNSWHDAVNKNNTAPYDDNGHGTHCMGTAVGTTKGIGVAPDAKWIACKGLDRNGSGSEATLSECGQWMACPDRDNNCTGHPHIVSNSWGGGSNEKWYNSIIDSWNAMGIVPVFAIGNAGSACGTANSPGDQPNLISVGSTDNADKISYFSSRGPGGNLFLRLFDNSKGSVKPEVSAPGSNIYSADYESDNGYRNLSGTSMATPAVAGASALILGAANEAGLVYTMKEVRSALQNTAVPGTVGLGQSCPTFTFSPPKQPNNVFGYGRIDVAKAVASIQQQ